jgi:protease-4
MDEPTRRRRWPWVALAVAVVLLACGGSTVGLAILAATGANGGGPLPSAGRVAVVYLTAPIAGVGDSGVFGGAVATPEGIIDQLRKADNDPTVKAVLLRIDSPGGTASASEEIAQAIAGQRKPVIASIGDVGASGAYMAASQSDEIWSTGASDVGSIGVIMQLTEYGDLLAKIGVKQFAITSGKYKDAGAPWGKLTPKEREMFQADADMVYEQFIALVAKGRSMPVAKVRELATGWAWPGQRAKELGLVDHIGNYTDALLAAAKAGGIKGYPSTVEYGRANVFDVFSGLAGAASLIKAPSATLPVPGLTTVPVPR